VPAWLGAARFVQPAFSRAVVLIHLRGLPSEENKMLRSIAVAGFALAIATSAQALTPAPISQPNDMITQVRFGCGPGRTLVAGHCVARTTVRHTRRVIRRSYY
jgi:hypothetical protein